MNIFELLSCFFVWPWPDIPERTPGYPLLLLLTGQLRPTRTLVYLQILLHLLAVYAVARALPLLAVRRALVVAFCFVMALPLYLPSTSHVLTETVPELTLAVELYRLLHYLASRSTRFLWASALPFA